jgi:hypothetical protein
MSSHLVHDWKYPRTAKAFTATLPGQRVQSTVLRCVSNSRIPCTAKELASMGKTRFTVTVLGISTGYAYAPYKKAQPGKKASKDPNAKPLFEEVYASGTVAAAKMYSFRKAKSNFDRDERDDSIVSTIHIGQVVSFFIQPFMYDAKESKSNKGEDRTEYIFPPQFDYIPEFTIIDMRVTISNNQTEGGYGLKLQKVTLHESSLYSYLGQDALFLLPSSEMQAKEMGEAWQTSNPFICNNLEAKNVAFFAKAPVGSYISSIPVVEGFYRIVGPNGAELFSGVPCVDISLHDLLKFSNKPATVLEDDVFDAITLLDFASSADALYLYVVATHLYKADPALSDFRGVPLVDSNEFLSCVSFEDQPYPAEAVFPLPYSIQGLEKPSLTVTTAPVSAQASPPPCPDFSLLFENCTIAKGYPFSIGTADAPEVLRMVFNIMGCQAQGGTLQRLDYLERAQKRRRPDCVMP